MIILFTMNMLSVSAQDFLRNLPEQSILQQITPERFKIYDAVIVLKEQAFSTRESSIDYRGLEITGPATTTTVVLIVKLLNEAGVKRYGSFEQTYEEWFGNEIPCGYAARARVLKPDGTVKVMPEGDIKRIVSRTNNEGDPLERKILFTIPDLAPGDVVQIERTLTQPLARSSGGIFFYSERDPVVFSNLAITLPAANLVHYVSFPGDRVGEPKIAQISESYGAGQTYFWSVKNVNRVPAEPYTFTFEDQSLMTAFYVDTYSPNGFRATTDWNSIATDYKKRYLNRDGISDARIQELGFNPRETSVNIETLDRLYGAIRKGISLVKNNSLYPLSGNIDSIFKKKRGDASDLAYVMLTILKQWKQTADAVWIRDRREGKYESQVPLSRWFDRLGVLVKVGDKEKLYDFDRSIPFQFDMPWFLSGIEVAVLSDKGVYHKPVSDLMGVADHFTREHHSLRLRDDLTIADTMSYEGKGAAIERFRTGCYDDDDAMLVKRIRDIGTSRCFAAVDTAWCDGLFTEAVPSMHFVGRAKEKAENVDTYLRFKLTDYSLWNLRDRIYSASRVSGVVLDEPFTIGMDWTIALPKGYDLQSGIENSSVSGPEGMNGTVTAARSGSTLRVTAEVKFPSILIPQPKYNDMISFIDKMAAAVGKDVVLKKQ